MIRNRIVYTTALWNTAGFLVGTVPPILIDPKLTDHVLYGPRQYQHTWIVYLFAGLLPILTILVGLVSERKSRPLTLNAPFLVMSLPMFAVLLPEFPHPQLLVVSIVTIVVSVATVFIHELNPYDREVGEMNVSARIELIKENISLWKTACIGLPLALLGSLVAIFAETRTVNASAVGDNKPQVLLMARAWYCFMAYACLYVFFGPVYECAAKVKASFDRLKEIGAPPKDQSEQRVERSAAASKVVL